MNVWCAHIGVQKNVVTNEIAGFGGLSVWIVFLLVILSELIDN
jgi:hypothetical protein